MAGLFGLLQTGKRSLLAQQFAQQIVGNNISNVNTEGYTRQVPRLTTSTALETMWGRVGAGVQIDGVLRIRDQYLDRMLRESDALLTEWEMREQLLSRVDSIFSSDPENGIGGRLDAFFNAWYDLANAPEGAQARVALRETAQGLVDTIRSTARQLRAQRKNVNDQVRDTIERVNSLLQQVAELNGNIAIANFGSEFGEGAELLDQRDRVLDELSSLLYVRVEPREAGGVSVYLGTHSLVEGSQANGFTFTTQEVGGLVAYFPRTEDGQVPQIEGGKLKALLDLRDITLKQNEEALDTLSRTLVEEINKYHKVGYTTTGATGLAFFNGEFLKASELRLADEILNDANNIIAAATDADGDNTQALRIAGLKDTPAIGRASLREFYATMVTNIGSNARTAADQVINYDTLKSQVLTQRESVSGVSLDEEMIEMIRYEQAYNAAARMITTVDEMIQTVIAMKA